MMFPRLVLIADRFSDPEVSRKVLLAIQAGVRWIQLRDHGCSTDNFDFAANGLSAKIRSIRRDVMVSVNSKLNVADALKAPFHTGAHGPTVTEAIDFLEHGQTVGKSVRSGPEADEARKDGASYVIFGSVFSTASHPGVEGSGLEALARVCKAAAPMPVIAIGGVTPERCSDCLRAGAHGIAVQSSILNTTSIHSVVVSYAKHIPGL